MTNTIYYTVYDPNKKAFPIYANAAGTEYTYSHTPSCTQDHKTCLDFLEEYQTLGKPFKKPPYIIEIPFPIELD